MGLFCREGHLPAILIEPEIIRLIRLRKTEFSNLGIFPPQDMLPVFCFLCHPSSIANCQDIFAILGNVCGVVLHHLICSEQVGIPLIDIVVSAMDNYNEKSKTHKLKVVVKIQPF